MFNLAALFGWDLLERLGAYVAVVLLALGIHLVVVYSLSVKFLGGMSPVTFFRGVQPAMLVAFSTASSNATLPTALKVAEERLFLPRRVSRFVLTIGATATRTDALFEGHRTLPRPFFASTDIAISMGCSSAPGARHRRLRAAR